MTALSYAFCRRNKLLQSGETGGKPLLRTCSGTPASALMEARRKLGTSLSVECIDEQLLMEQINAAFQQQNSDAMSRMDDISNEVDLDALVDEIPDDNDLLDSTDDAPVIRLINALFSEALRLNASDIHVETYERDMAVRLRVDGMLQEVLRPSRRLAPLLVSRIKVMARLDIAEKRIPQDGRISVRIAGRGVDVRVSTIPASHGERVVMRLLDKQAARIDLPQLGMPPDTLQQFTRLLQNPNGIILVTGPTGSGKTTTLYAGLSLLNERHRNILTVEDPVEYDIAGIGQTQVNTRAGMTFSKGLRAILRQDPDVVMVGEIRDAETAEIAVQASLTGHLVLSTLHTNNAVAAVTRMLDIGIEPYLIASSLKGVLAQRLLRKICAACAEQETLSEGDAQALGDAGFAGTAVPRAVGCPQCNHSGYSGRTGIYELLPVDAEIAELIHNGESESAITTAATGMRTLLDEGRRLLREGQTTTGEVLRCVRQDGNDVIL